MKKILFIILAVTILLGNSCQDKATLEELEKFKSQAQLEEQNKIVAQRFHDDLAVERNWDLAEEFLDPNFVIHSATGENITGIEEVKKFDEMYKNMHNIKINHYEIVAEGDYVFIRWDVAFDNTSDIMGIPATGNRISGIYGMDLFIIKDGKITDMWQNYDELGYLKQLGAIPSQ